MFMSPQLAAKMAIIKKIKGGMIASMLLASDVEIQPQDLHPILDNILGLVTKDVLASKLLIRIEPSLNQEIIVEHSMDEWFFYWYGDRLVDDVAIRNAVIDLLINSQE